METSANNCSGITNAKQTLARASLAALVVIGVWAVRVCLFSSSIPIVLLPLCLIAFFSGSARFCVRVRSRSDYADAGAAHAIVIASSITLSPYGGVLPAVFSSLGHLAIASPEGIVKNRAQLLSRPVASLGAGLAFRSLGGSLSGPNSLLCVVAAASIYAAVHYLASVCECGWKWDRRDFVAASRRFVLAGSAGYLIAVILAVVPTQAVAALFVVGIAAAMGSTVGIEEDAIEEVSTVASPTLLHEVSAKDHGDEAPSVMDSLTGTANQRYLTIFLDQEISRSKRNGHPLSILLLDVDGLEKINRSKGRAVGDEVLKGVAESLRTMLRDYDVVARYSDDEFAVVLPETTAENALDIAERIHEFLSDLKHADSKGKSFTAGISIGVASFPDHGEGADALTSSAHHALNRAKFSSTERVQSCHKLAKAS